MARYIAAFGFSAKYDTVVVESDDSCIKFNTGRIWYNIKHDAHDYFMDVELADSRPLAIYSDDIISDTKNRNQDFTIEELCYIGLMNTEGSKIYMDDKSGAVREAVFQVLTGRESKYFRYVGIFETEDWVEVPTGTESGFFSGKVLSEADMNFLHALSSYIDFSRVMSTLYLEGALIITMLFAAGAIEAAPYILANFQALTHYVKTFGVRQGLDRYRYLGVQNLPNGVISWLQMDMADGDSSIDDVLTAKQLKHPMNKHMPSRFSYQLQHMSEEVAKEKIANQTFFDASWTEYQVMQALNMGYRQALKNGVTTGKYIYQYLGRNITIYMQDGVFRTGYGDIIYTYEELIKMIGVH